MKQSSLFVKISIVSSFLIISSANVNAQSRDTSKVKDVPKFHIDSVVYAIDGAIVTKLVFDNLKEQGMGLIAYPGTIFNLARTRTVMMKVTAKNAESEAVVKLRNKAKELGMKTYGMTRSGGN